MNGMALAPIYTPIPFEVVYVNTPVGTITKRRSNAINYPQKKKIDMMIKLPLFARRSQFERVIGIIRRLRHLGMKPC